MLTLRCLISCSLEINVATPVNANGKHYAHQKPAICDCMHVVPHYADLHFSLHGAPLCRHNYFKVCRMVNLP